MPVPPDIYETDVDFTTLALRYPDFAKKLKGNRQLDFSDPDSVRQLTKALLHRDFGLSISLPEDRLCPPVPNRFNYVVFAQKLLDSTQEDYNENYNSKRRIIGLDIGTGASAIYPLLACQQRTTWLFLATEIDEKSRSFAARNIKINNLTSRIKLLDCDLAGKTIIPTQELERFEKIDILLTNPPFYTSETELEALAKQKARPPNSACTGAAVEMICPGGEVSFVSQIIHESTLPQNRHKISWFSSMLGKLGSVTIIIEKLMDAGCTNYAVTDFVQGQKTRRWCVAWSWSGLRPLQNVARGTDAVDKKYLPFPAELDIIVHRGRQEVDEKVNNEISKLSEMEWQWRSALHAGIARSMQGDVWSRRARRKLHATKKQDAMEIDPRNTRQKTTDDVMAESEDSDTEATDQSEPKFAVKITCVSANTDTMKDVSTPETTMVKLRWLQGADSTIFESFHGWLKRRLTQ